MKLTDENLDYPDCMPPRETNPIKVTVPDWMRVPDWMQKMITERQKALARSAGRRLPPPARKGQGGAT